MKTEAFVGLIVTLSAILFDSIGQNNTYPLSGTVNILGSGLYNNSAASSLILRNTTANKSWQWHALDNGGIQLNEFMTGNIRFLIDPSGNVGIGEPNPGSKLDISGGSILVDAGQYIYGNQTSGSRGYIKLYDGSTGNLELGTTFWNGAIAFMTGDSNTERMRITGTGNVGIGEPNPSSKLDISGGSILVDASQYIYGNQTSGNRGYIKLYDGSTGNLELGTTFWDGAIAFMTGSSNSEKMRITGSGSVGIGTPAPDVDAKLTVAGKIHSREVKVSVSAGSDFVFENDYQLFPIHELEAYIKKNKHLPDIAPEKEMLEQGLEIGKFQIKLLQKIEELTLYIIELKKENEQSKREIENLKTELKNFK